MKKIFGCGLILLFLLTIALYADSREITEVYKAYEAFVVEAENLAKKPSVSIDDFSGLTEKAEVMGEKANAVIFDKDFTVQDGQRFAALSERFQKAWAAIMPKLTY